MDFHTLYTVTSIDSAVLLATVDVVMYALAFVSAPFGIGVMLGTLQDARTYDGAA